MKELTDDFMTDNSSGPRVYIGMTPNFSSKIHIAHITEEDTNDFDIICGSRLYRLRVQKGKLSNVTCKKCIKLMDKRYEI